jgi:hypothetical protein
MHTKIVHASDFPIARASVRSHCQSLGLSEIRTVACEATAISLLSDGRTLAYAVGEAKQQAGRYSRRPYQPSKQQSLRAVQ